MKETKKMHYGKKIRIAKIIFAPHLFGINAGEKPVARKSRW